jgi:hypothetical protein
MAQKVRKGREHGAWGHGTEGERGAAHGAES